MWTLKSVFCSFSKNQMQKVTQYSTHPSLKFPGKHKHTKKKIVNYYSSFILKIGNNRKTTSYVVSANSEINSDKHKMIWNQKENLCSAKGIQNRSFCFTALRNITKFSKKNSLQQPQGGKFRFEVRAKEKKSTLEGRFSRDCSPGKFKKEKVWVCAGCGGPKEKNAGKLTFCQCVSYIAQGRGFNSWGCAYCISLAKKVFLPQKQGHFSGFLLPFAYILGNSHMASQIP